jgi:anaerobic selenocysteine-containing dehydrogenase
LEKDTLSLFYSKSTKYVHSFHAGFRINIYNRVEIMSNKVSINEIKGYCSQCSCYCPTLSIVKGGRFVEVKSDDKHPNSCGVCPKGLAGPELVYSQQRLQYPIRRTTLKGDPNPNWERISWDEALDTIANKLNEIKAKFGPEAVAFARCGPAGSPMSEIDPWVSRLAHAFGTPNTISTTHICQWHRDNCSAYTYGKPGTGGTQGRPEYERASCILIWGNNTHATRQSFLPLIKRSLEKGAKLIVIDSRKTEIAAMADLWLQVCPGTDGALALGMINLMMEENLFDYDFVRSWTNAILLVRSDTGSLLKANELMKEEDTLNYVMIDSVSHSPMSYAPGMTLSAEPVLDGVFNLTLANGQKVECKTAFMFLRDLVSQYPLTKAEVLTQVPADKIREATRMFATLKPACWYSYNGIEQSKNASQTNRAICIFYALTGCYDMPGGNVVLPTIPVNPIDGREFLSPEAERKRLGFSKRPLGPAGITQSIQANEVYRAILTGEPYPVKALIGFGGNIIMSNAPSTVAKEAISKLDFHVQSELFLSPTAALADIVLPAASFWESWHVRINVESFSSKSYIQLRPAVVLPQHESWPDMKIIFELGKKLGLGDKFWDGNIEAAFDYQFAPANITVEQLRLNPSGIPLHLPMEYQKYCKKDNAGKFFGFPTASKRVEIYSQIYKDHGYNPLPDWKEPIFRQFANADIAKSYPLILIGAKVIEYCHSQHRAIPSLRKAVPYPFVEINPVKANELGIKDGEWVLLETPYGSITLRAKLTKAISYDVICTQNGWWQGCHELNLPGFDPYSPEGANVNLLYGTDEIDSLSGSLPLKGYPCNVRKK